MWSGSFDFAPERWIYFLITWAIKLTFIVSFSYQKEEIVGKIYAVENCDGLSVTKCALHIRALFIFSAGNVSLLIVATHLFFAQYIASLMVYNKIVKNECCATVWYIFPKIHRYETVV